jgi:hypothetical protein
MSGGSIRLTDLGRQAADASQEDAARVEAFLHVPLYAQLYEHNKGYQLPPASALEKYVREIGVSSKQTSRARQAFMRSARQAGFFAHGEDRLVRPAGPGTKPIDAPPSTESNGGNKSKTGGSGGGKDPLIAALIQKLPPEGPWPVDERVTWLKMLAMAFQITYGQEAEIRITKEAAN